MGTTTDDPTVDDPASHDAAICCVSSFISLYNASDGWTIILCSNTVHAVTGDSTTAAAIHAAAATIHAATAAMCAAAAIAVCAGTASNGTATTGTTSPTGG